MQEHKLSGWWKALIAILIIVGLPLNGWLCYYELVLKEATVVIDTSFVDTAGYRDEETYFMEVNYYSNEKKNGVECMEFKFNYYIDTSIPDKGENGSYDNKYMFSTGVQLIDGENYYRTYNTTNGISQTVTHFALNNATFYASPDGLDQGYKVSDATLGNSWIFDIGGKLCLIENKGLVKTDSFWWWNYYADYDIQFMIASSVMSIQSLKNGTTITAFNFSDYLKVTKVYDEESGQFREDLVDENITKYFTFMNVKVNKTDNGMIEAKNSVFNSYKGDTEWSFHGIGDRNAYWRDETIYDIDSDDFKFISVDNGYSIELKDSCIEYLSEFSDVVLNVEINLDDFSSILNIIGFTKKPFKNLNVNSIKITSSTQKDFTVYGFDDMDIHTENVNIVHGGV